jgi:hypothetical protein
MTAPTSHDDASLESALGGLFGQLVDKDEKVLRQFSALCKGAQMQALYGKSPRLADWFQSVALIILDERHRRVGKDMRLGDPDVRLREHTLALSQRDLEAVAMGFARMLEKASPETGAKLTPLIDVFYEPVRVELMQRLAEDDQRDEPGTNS